MVTAQLRPIVAELGRMPTNSELCLRGRGDLANQIVKRGGYKTIADRLGVTQVTSDSSFGWEGELTAMGILQEAGFEVERSAQVRWTYDLLVDGCVRVDVKTAIYAEYGPCKGWFFRIGKRPQSDVIMLLQKDTGFSYYLHWMDCPFSNITISRNGGKYNRFLNAYSVISMARDSILHYRSKIPKVEN